MLLGDEDALGEADVGQLEAGAQVADRVDAGQVGLAVLVDQDEAAVHGDADLVVAETLGDRAAADGDEQQLGVEGLAVLEGDGDAGVGDLGVGEADAELEVDAALAEGALEPLGASPRPRAAAGAAAPRRW